MMHKRSNGKPNNEERGRSGAWNRSGQGADRRADFYPEDAFEDDEDLFDDISLGEAEEDDYLFDDNEESFDDEYDYGDTDFSYDDEGFDDEAIARDAGMEDKIFNQAMHERRGAEPGTAGSGRAKGRENAGNGSSRSNPRELNTATSAIDRRKASKEKEQKKKGSIKRIIAMVLVEALTLCLIFGYGFLLRRWNLFTRPGVDEKIVENENITMEKKKEMEGYWTIAAFGLDTRSMSNLGGSNSDVIMLISINMDTGDIKLCSVFRDTYLNISDTERAQYNKINAAYAYGGPQQALAALNKNLDLNIKNYVTVNWESVAEAINILGGVDDVEISNAEFYYINAYITDTVKGTGIGSHQLKSAGTQHLDGVQAVAYARLRYMDNDFARTERQKIILKKAFEKAKQADFATLNNILVTCSPNILTNISMNQVVRMAQGITKYNIAETGGFPWSRGDALISGKGACVIPTTLESNVVRLHEFLFGDENYQPSSAVLQYSERIKSDSNLYKEGVPIESVATDMGVIQRPKTSAAGTDGDDEDEDAEEQYTIGTDADGNLVYPTDENGDLIVPTDENGDVIYPTDEDGNTIRPNRETRPIETRPTDLAEETEGDAGSEIVDDNGNVISPGESGTHAGSVTTRPQETSRPSEGSTSQQPGTQQSGTQTPGGSTSTHPDSGSTTQPGGSTEASTQAPTAAVSNEPGAAPGGSTTVPGGTVTPGGSDLAPGSTEGPGGITPVAQTNSVQSITPIS